MLNRLFDSPAQLLILLLIILLLFGASRLPNTARQMGRSMRIFRSEMKEMKTENPSKPKDGDADEDDDERASRIEALEGRVVDDRATGSTPADSTPAATQPAARNTDADRDR